MRGAQLTNFLFVRICILVFEHHVRRVFSWFYVSLSRFFSRSLLESAPCRGASHSSLCSQLRRSLCSQLRSSQCRALRSGLFVVQKKKEKKRTFAPFSREFFFPLFEQRTRLIAVPCTASRAACCTTFCAAGCTASCTGPRDTARSPTDSG